jgi:hypothetical protein
MILAVATARGDEDVFPGADENTPSRSMYFSWISNTNEGSTEGQTLANLDFFKWLHDEYGMQLDVYLFDAGNIDAPWYSGTLDSDKFKRQFPNGFKPIYEKAKSFGCRLGVWLGPDGFGDTPEQEQARIDMLSGLCRDYDFALFKFDSVGGRLRPEKQDAFIRLMKECRKYNPDLIALSHRLNLGKAQPYLTTKLWEGAETYIDVWMWNKQTASHNRAGALSRNVPPDLTRLVEDSGVCLSSCLDYWEDDLVLQAFNRCFLMAPETYGNPWLMHDDEFPKLARIHNLHRRYRDLLVHGMTLPEEQYGPLAVSRGDGNTRLITLRNLTWEPVEYKVGLDESIGLTGEGQVELRQFSPSERIIGQFEPGESVAVKVPPFRVCLLLATAEPCDEIGVTGCDYEVVRDTAGKPAIVRLLAAPGSEATIRLADGDRKFVKATLDGEPVDALVKGRAVTVQFPGTPPKGPWHHKLGDLKSCDVPDDAEALYEATCFAADNNALEVRSLLRSGPTKIPQVRAARDAFFGQQLFTDRACWDKNLFDGKTDTRFRVSRPRVWAGYGIMIPDPLFRLDLGEPTTIDKLVFTLGGKATSEAKVPKAEVSADLKKWTPAEMQSQDDKLVIQMPADQPIRYVRIAGGPEDIAEIEGYRGDTVLDRSKWRASNRFAPYEKDPAVAAWSFSCQLDEAFPGGYLAIPIAGKHGKERAYAAVRVDDKPVGAPSRATSFGFNPWELSVRETDGNYTYYVPVTEQMVGKRLDAVVLLLKGGNADVKPEAWMTAYPIPLEARELVLTEAE